MSAVLSSRGFGRSLRCRSKRRMLPLENPSNVARITMSLVPAAALTSGELLQEHMGGSRVVKAFNGIGWEHLRDIGRPTGSADRIGIPISGDDAEAKRVVADLTDQIGFDAVDAEPLAEGGRKHQPGTAVYGKDMKTDELRRTLDTPTP